MHPSPVLQRAIKRLALTTKQAGKDYYKGTGTGAMGRHTKYGGYIIDPKKVRTYVCPSQEALSNFAVSEKERFTRARAAILMRSQLTPFVARRIEPRRDSFAHTETNSPMDGKEWLEKWKTGGGHD